MFVKLLKYEWRMNRGLIGLLCAVIGISGVLTGGILRYMTWSSVTGNEFMVIAYTIILTAAVLAIFGCCVGAMYLLVYRFYQSRFSDQGYLMMTLPVSTHQQLLSSFVGTVTGVGLVGLTAVSSAAVGMGIFLISFEQNTGAELWQIFAETGRSMMENLGISGSLMVLNGIKMVASFLADVVLFMLALTVGAQSYKHPVLKGAAMYIGIDIAVTEGCVLLGSLSGSQMLTEAVSCLVYGALAVGAYLVMYRIIDKKLNLV